MFQPDRKIQKKQIAEDEDYQKQIIGLIHENIKDLAQGRPLKSNLNKTLSEGQEITNILNKIGEKDLIPFLQSYKKATEKVALEKLPEEKLVTPLLKIKGVKPEMIDFGLLLDVLKVKFKKDIIQNILRRDFIEKESSELGAKMKEMEANTLRYSSAAGDSKGILYQQLLKQNIMPDEIDGWNKKQERKDLMQAEFKFGNIKQALMEEILKLNNREDEYKNIEPQKLKEIWQKLEKINNGIEQAQKERIKPVIFFDQPTLEFLIKLFYNRFNNLMKKQEYRENLEREYLQKYYI